MLCLALASVACGEDEPEHTYEAGIEPTSGSETNGGDTGGGIDESEALNIALALAEQEGHDIHAYSDIVVHTNDGGDWVIQLRRPRMHRFLEVVVSKTDGAGVLTVKSAGADG
jgi:hypothetical protein